MLRSRNTKVFILAVLALCLLGSFAGCGSGTSRQAAVMAPDRERESSDALMSSPAPTMAPAAGRSAAANEMKSDKPQEQGVVATVSLSSVTVPGFDRKIIKNAEMALQVKDAGAAVDQVTGLATEYGGYIISSRSWSEGPYRLATVTLSVPVDSFEEALRRLRGMAAKVLSEQASGQDVTEQYVDLESRLRNLEATETRIRGFLEQAVSVQEALEVNRQLSDIDGQIEEVKGKMAYMKGRAAFSTINVNLQPERPTPTPTPLPAWQPVQTFNDAGGSLLIILRFVGDLIIWLAVILLPFIIPLALLIWAIVAWQRRRSRRTKGAQTENSASQPQN